MLEVFLCHAPQDASEAQRISGHLERWGDVQVLREPCDSIPETWDGGLSSDAILLLLSPDSVPKGVGIELWAPVLDHLEGNGAPPLASVLLRPCSVPGRLKRKRHHSEARLRNLERWVMGLHSPAPSAPAPPAEPEDRRSLLDDLWQNLVDRAGNISIADPHASRLARQFASEAGEHFRQVIWMDCLGRARALLLGELAWRLGLPAYGTLPEVAGRVAEALAGTRLLVIFDGLERDLPIRLPEESRSSILRTPPVRFAISPERAGQLATVPAQSASIPETEAAVEYALDTDWDLARRLAQRACVFLKSEARSMEAAYLYERVREEAVRRADEAAERWCREELSWLLDRDRIQPVELAGSQLSFDLGEI